MQLAPTRRQTEVVEVGQSERCPNGHRLGPREPSATDPGWQLLTSEDAE
jgi:hypothetical protein